MAIPISLERDEISLELSRSLELLSTTSPNMLERHCSIRAVFDHSRNMLSSEEQRVFRKLSVFQGCFRRAAAEREIGASLSMLATLVDKSLLRRNASGGYEMHELIRQYAAEQLVAAPLEKEAMQACRGS